MPTWILALVLAVQTPATPAWLAGCWELRSGNRESLEMWMPPAGGMMVGASRTIVGGVVREYEQLVIKVESGKLVFTATPSGQQTASFTATSVTDTGFVVENPQHDFPQRIIYRRRGADSLIARIEGPAGSATGTRGVDFPMRRTSCTGS
jgi:hypothetical protein